MGMEASSVADTSRSNGTAGSSLHNLMQPPAPYLGSGDARFLSDASLGGGGGWVGNAESNGFGGSFGFRTIASGSGFNPSADLRWQQPQQQQPWQQAPAAMPASQLPQQQPAALPQMETRPPGDDGGTLPTTGLSVPLW